MSRYKTKKALVVEGLVADLLATEGELHPDTRNFQIAQNFVLSNLREHTFPDANEHLLKRQMAGLVEKFKIHNQVDKADELEKQLRKLDKCALDPDHRAAILWALACLSDNPLESELIPKGFGDALAKFVRAKETDEFCITKEEEAEMMDDWGWDADEPSDFSDEELESEAVSPTDEIEQISQEPQTPEKPAAPASGLSSAHFGGLPMFPLFTSPEVPLSVKDPQAEEPVGSPWDDPRYLQHAIETSFSQERSQGGLGLHFNPADTLSELSIVSDVLYMLAGARSQLFSKSGTGGFVQSRPVQCTHLSAGAVESVLAYFTRLATKAAHIRSFSKAVDPSATVTGLRCAAGQIVGRLFSWVTDRQVTLASQSGLASPASIESQPNQDRLVSLLSLRVDLQPFAADIDLITEVIEQAVYENENHAYRSSYLLSYLYYLIQEAGEIPATPLRLFHGALTPYLQLVAEWMVWGTLDSIGELFVSKITEDAEWSEGYCIQTAENEGGTVLWVPVFFTTEMHEQVLTAGKAMSMVRIIEDNRMMHIGHSVDGLYEEMLEALQQGLGHLLPSSDS